LPQESDDAPTGDAKSKKGGAKKSRKGGERERKGMDTDDDEEDD